uniref:Vacuolar protein sorting-associated protein 8 central domain-containing protein n=1 Tax=Candidozyma auris TaxID=498019 RepID=A0A0L0P377_CANAR
MADGNDESADQNGDANTVSQPISSTPLSTPSILLTAESHDLLAPKRRRKFDDRSQSKTSVQLRAHTVSPNNTKTSLLRVPSTSDPQHLVKWTETRQILKIINSPEFLFKFGAPQLIQLSQHHIAVGTEKGVIVGFTYRQEADYVLVPYKRDTDISQEISLSHICCMAFSSNAFFAAAGYKDGSIAVWELGEDPSSSQFHVIYADGVIQPISLENRFGRNLQGHLNGVPVISIDFIGDQEQQIVSTDLSGLAFFHRGFKRFLRKYYSSQKILGKNDTNSPDPLGKLKIHDCEMLSIGTSPQITDTIGLMAVITKTSLTILSIRSLANPESPYPKVHLKFSRPKSITDDSQGCLSWYPCIQVHKDINNAKLAYAWRNTVAILELDNRAISADIMSKIAEVKEKDKALPQLKFHKTGSSSVSERETIVSLNWLNSEILTAITQHESTTETKLYFFYYGGKKDQLSLTQVGVDDLDSQQISTLDVKLDERIELTGTKSFKGSLKILRHRLVLLVNSHSPSHKTLLSGRCLKWADRLIDYLQQGEFESALYMSYDYYVSGNYGKLVLHGLPHNEKERRAVVKPILKRVMRESIHPLFEDQVDAVKKTNIWNLYLTLASILSEHGIIGDDILGMLDEIFDLFGDDALFFDVLEDYITSQEIKNLSPITFRGLIESYTHSDRREHLAEIICLLDSSSLDIDLALALCEMYNLRECRIYIWNAMLKDYTTPLISLMTEMSSKEMHHDDTVIVFTYMSYILTGRQYPSDRVLDSSVEDFARNSICEILFSIGPYKWPRDTDEILLSSYSDKIFPYLTFFLKFDTFETMVTLNEFFENPTLNDGSGTSLTRQYIVEALLDIFEANEDLRIGQHKVHLAIFIARNYPKYFQFIRLSETVLIETVNTLCDNTKEDLHEDCELALESLLSVYDVENDIHLVEQMKAAKFYDVLFKVYKFQGKYAEAMEMWLERNRKRSSSDAIKNFAVLADLLKSTFNAEKQNTTELLHFIQFIEDNYDELISNNTDDMVSLVRKYNPELNLMVLKCKNDSLALNYLSSYFGRETSSTLNRVSLRLISRYIELLSIYEIHSVKDVITKYISSLDKHEDVKDSIRKILKQAGLFELLALMLCHEKEYEAAVKVLWNAIQSLHNKEESLDETALSFLKSYIDISITVSAEAHQIAIWTIVVENAVIMSDQARDQKLRDILNDSIFQCFRAMEHRDFENKEESIFKQVFNHVLTVAKVANIRETLQDILTSYLFESEMHELTVKKVNQRIYKYMEMIKSEELMGWLVSNKQCTSCGKLMWGEEMLERHAWAWEERQKSMAFGLKTPFDNKKFEDCDIYLFKCSHGYHKRCLEHIGGNKRCVICSPE